MIPKANQRAGGRQLATHLLNEFDNDRVEVADLRGAIADHLHGAFHEWAATAASTKCQKFLYSLSVNPDPRQRPVTREEYYDYIARVEKALGLAEQPRAVVFHVKYGREHCHVVWSRIDTENMKAVQLSHDRQKLRTVTQEFAQAHGLELPRGMQANGLKDRFNTRASLENLGEKQQEERTGISKAERMAAITSAWRESDNAASFVDALVERGYFLARGDKRAFVVVDLYGEIHAVARQIEGVNTKDVKARLADIDLDKLPDAQKAQDYARQQLESKRAAVPETSKEAATRMRTELDERQRERRNALDERRKDLFAQHRAEQEALEAAQDSEEKGIVSARLRAQPKGVIGFITRITGIRLLVAHRHKKEDQARAARHVAQREALKLRHARETKDFQHRYRGLLAVEFRERRSLETALRRREFRLIAGHAPAPAKQTALVQQPQRPGLTAEQRARLEAMRRAGLATTSAPARQRSPDSRTSKPFTDAAAREKTDDTDKLRQDSDALDEVRRAARETTTPPSESGGDGGLTRAFNDAQRRDQARAKAKEFRNQQRKNRGAPGSDRDREP